MNFRCLALFWMGESNGKCLFNTLQICNKRNDHCIHFLGLLVRTDRGVCLIKVSFIVNKAKKFGD